MATFSDSLKKQQFELSRGLVLRWWSISLGVKGFTKKIKQRRPWGSDYKNNNSDSKTEVSLLPVYKYWRVYTWPPFRGKEERHLQPWMTLLQCQMDLALLKRWFLWPQVLLVALMMPPAERKRRGRQWKPEWESLHDKIISHCSSQLAALNQILITLSDC